MSSLTLKPIDPDHPPEGLYPLIQGAADAVLQEMFACINAKLGGQSPSTGAV